MVENPVGFYVNKFSQWAWKAVSGSPPFLLHPRGPLSATVSSPSPPLPAWTHTCTPEAAHHESRASCVLELETQECASSHPPHVAKTHAQKGSPIGGTLALEPQSLTVETLARRDGREVNEFPCLCLLNPRGEVAAPLPPPAASALPLF